MNGLKSPALTETCRFGKNDMLPRVFRVMEDFHLNGCFVTEDTGLDNAVATRRMKAYSFTVKRGRTCRRLSCRGTGWRNGALRLAAACL